MLSVEEEHKSEIYPFVDNLITPNNVVYDQWVDPNSSQEFPEWEFEEEEELGKEPESAQNEYSTRFF